MLKEKQGVGWFIFLAVLFLVSSAVLKTGAAHAGEGTLTGYVQHRSEFGLETPRRYAVSEFLGNLELNYKYDEQWAIHTILRGRYDGIYDLREDFKRDVSAGDRDNLRSEGEVREIYLDYKPIENLSFRAGRQVVIWGESDGLRLMDMINPLDLKWGYLTRDFEDIRTPLVMLRTNYKIPGLDRYMAGVELIWIPGDFEVNEIAPAGAAWAPESPVFFNSQMQGLVGMGLLPVVTDDKKPQTLKNSRYGAKFTGHVAGTDFSLNYLHTYADSAVFHFAGIGAAPPPFVGSFNLEAKYPWKHIVGATFNHDFGLVVARGEVAYEFNNEFQNLTKPDWTEKSDYLKGMLGFDYVLGIPGFNRGRTIFISGQVFNFHIVDHNNNIVNLPYGYTVKQDEQVLTLLMNTGFLSDSILPEIFVAYDPSYSSWWIHPKLGLAFGSKWRIEVGANIFEGKNTQRLPFGTFDKDDTAYVQLRYML